MFQYLSFSKVKMFCIWTESMQMLSPKVYAVSKRGCDFIHAIIVAIFGHDWLSHVISSGNHKMHQ